MVLNESAKRLGIFFFYDKDGIVDEYVIYYLRKINPFFEETLVVCNGKLMPEGREKLECLENTTVLVRENKGFDVWAYKTGIEYIGWKRLHSNVDELIMFNFTIMGPVNNFDEMFDEMSRRDVDFWGVTIHNGAPFDPWGIMEDGEIPVHIQSHFIAVRKRMLSSFEFQQYWKNMPMIKRYEEAVGLHEAIFTKKFEESGYTWSVYVDTEDLLDETFYPMFNMPIELIENRKCPFFKRKLFIQDWNSCIDENGYYAGAELYEYLKNETAYDTDMIVKHIMRTGNLCDFINAINSRFVIPSKSQGKESRAIRQFVKRTAAIISVEKDTHYYFKPYMKNIVDLLPCYIFAPDRDKFEKLVEGCERENITYIEQDSELPESQWLQLLSEISDKYDYICKIGDVGGDYLETLTNLRSYAKVSYECMLHSESYINSVIELFERNKCLGILLPLSPLHSEYFGLIGNEWGGKKNYKSVCEALNELDIDVPISYETRPVVSLSGCMWFRTAALERLYKNSLIEDIEEALEKKEDGETLAEDDMPKTMKRICSGMKFLWSYAAQKKGFYSSYVCPSHVAANQMVSYNNVLGKINDDMRNTYSLHRFLFDTAADFIKIEINFDNGSGYARKNLQSEVIIREKYSIENVVLRFNVLPGTKEMVINIADGLMCICRQIDFSFRDTDDCEVKVKYKKTDTADMNMANGIDCFYNPHAEYRLIGDFSHVETVVISCQQLAVIPVIYGMQSVKRKNYLVNRVYKFLVEK